MAMGQKILYYYLKENYFINQQKRMYHSLVICIVNSSYNRQQRSHIAIITVFLYRYFQTNLRAFYRRVLDIFFG